jgi:mono/diheme cytochrome c family protein
MTGGLRLITGIAVTACWLSPSFADDQKAPSAPHEPSEYRAVLNQYCVTCHNARLKTGGLTLDTADLGKVTENAELWEKVIKKLRTASMPPPGVPRPDAKTAQELAASLETALDREAVARPNPGRPLLHRLNRAEYANVIRDLLALDIDVVPLLPPDDSSHGFDNVADVLGVSPALLERYLAAATKISAIAVGDPEGGIDSKTYIARADATQREHVEGLPFGTRGGLLIQQTLPLNGEYLIRVKLFRTNAGYIRGLGYPHELEITVDDQRVFLQTVGTPEEYSALLANPAASAAVDAKLQARIPIAAGPHTIGVTFLEKTAAQAPTLLRPLLSNHDPIDADGVPKVDSVLISGPYDAKGAGDTPSRRRIFSCRPARAQDEEACARTILSTLARRAYRRPLSEADLRPLLEFYHEGRSRGTFETGIELSLRRILADPNFLFRAERDPETLAAGTVYRVPDLELASRLSFFLWSTLPDEQLLNLANQGKLRNPVALEAQVRRMIADPRSEALVTNFAGQWLRLRNLQRANPDSMEFPDFDDSLRQGLQRETEMLFASVLREDRPILDLLTADYTFVNERLAKHYGIPNVYGTRFRRVAITDEARKGLLGQGSILTVTSYPNRTSPVLRGKWIMENILGSPPPPPPPNVPALKENTEGAKALSVRERMEQHRANPACANCHKLFDPMGIAMENFDATGAWRSRDAGVAIDSAIQLADGTNVAGVVQLRQALLRNPDTFVRTVTENLLTYALGRGLTASDMPAVRSIMRESGKDKYRFESLILEVVKSVPFEMRVTAAPVSAVVAVK